MYVVEMVWELFVMLFHYLMERFVMIIVFAILMKYVKAAFRKVQD